MFADSVSPSFWGDFAWIFPHVLPRVFQRLAKDEVVTWPVSLYGLAHFSNACKGLCITSLGESTASSNQSQTIPNLFLPVGSMVHVWYIYLYFPTFTYIYHINQPNVDKYIFAHIPDMHPMGYSYWITPTNPIQLVFSHNNISHGMNFWACEDRRFERAFPALANWSSPGTSKRGRKSGLGTRDHQAKANHTTSIP